MSNQIGGQFGVYALEFLVGDPPRWERLTNQPGHRMEAASINGNFADNFGIFHALFREQSGYSLEQISGARVRNTQNGDVIYTQPDGQGHLVRLQSLSLQQDYEESEPCPSP